MSLTEDLMEETEMQMRDAQRLIETACGEDEVPDWLAPMAPLAEQFEALIPEGIPAAQVLAALASVAQYVTDDGDEAVLEARHAAGDCHTGTLIAEALVLPSQGDPQRAVWILASAMLTVLTPSLKALAREAT